MTASSSCGLAVELTARSRVYSGAGLVFRPVDIALGAFVVAVLFVVLLVSGRGQIAKGSNARVANGAVLLTLAAIVGLLALGLLLSLDVW